MEKTEEELLWIEAVLSNDENSTDEELLAHFIANGLSEENAKIWISKRDCYLNAAIGLPSEGNENA